MQGQMEHLHWARRQRANKISCNAGVNATKFDLKTFSFLLV